MNKIEYLKALKEALQHIDISVMEEIAADYEEHFQVGMENGKSEEQICEELGSIDDLVKEINAVYNTDKKEYSYEGTDNQQAYSARDTDDTGYDGSAPNRISDVINRVLDSTSDAINQALHATSEAISKVDTNEIGDRLKNTLEEATSRLSDLAENGYRKHFGSFDPSTIYRDNISKSYDNVEPGGQKINLVVDGICANVVVKESTDDKINIRYENNGSERQRQKYAFYSFMEGNTVYAGIRNAGNAVFMFNLKAYAITIYLEVPSGIGVVDIKTASGDIRADHVSPERFYADTASGDISVGRIELEELKLNSASGDIRIQDGNSVHVKAVTISGDIEAKNLTAKNLSLKSTSGDVDANNTVADSIEYYSLSGSLDNTRLRAEKCRIKSTSGDIEISDSSINNADVSSMSGDIDLTNIAGDSLSVKSTSGDVDLDANVRRCQASSKSGDIDAVLNGDVALESDSTSGSINIRLKNYGNGYRIKSRTVSGILSIQYSDLHQRNLKTGTYAYGNQGSELILSSISGDIRVKD
ncbi:MAG: DUF4097 family beta strand repeat protein [Clostridiaceae bacterium]|nr:DUF4097 family beta strand repeat protein [Clostridiaceae bacterium]